MNKHIALELEQGFESLIIKLKVSNLLQHPILARQIKSIAIIFQQKINESKDYSIFAFAKTQMESLLKILLDLGFDEIVTEFAEIKLSNVPMVNVYTGEWEQTPKNISDLKFLPSLTKLRQIQKMFANNNVETIWIAVELLFYLEWCWNTEESIFGAANITGIDYSGQYQYWLEINVLKNHKKESSTYFNKDKIMSCLRLLMKEMFQWDQIDLIAEDFPNFLLELKLIENDMKDYSVVLEIHSINNFISKSCTIHEFQSQNLSSFLTLVKAVFNAPYGEWVNINKISTTSGVTTSGKFFERIKCPSQLKDTFFEIDRSQIRLRKQPIDSKSLSISHRKYIQDMFQGLSGA